MLPYLQHVNVICTWICFVFALQLYESLDVCFIKDSVRVTEQKYQIIKESTLLDVFIAKHKQDDLGYKHILACIVAYTL